MKANKSNEKQQMVKTEEEINDSGENILVHCITKTFSKGLQKDNKRTNVIAFFSRWPRLIEVNNYVNTLIIK